MSEENVASLLAWGLMVLAILALSGMGGLLLLMKWILTGTGLLERRAQGDPSTPRWGLGTIREEHK